MRLGRFDLGDRVEYAIVRGDELELLGPALPDRAAIDRGGTRVPVGSARALVPVEPSKIIGVGRNYAQHAEEMGLEVGAVPSVFLKPLETLVAHEGAVVLPPRRLSTHVEHEGEIAVVIGRRAHRVPAEEVHEYVLGLTCADDVSARDLQKSDPQITRGKGFDTFCPLGPLIETSASIDEERALSCSVNGALRQSASSSRMLFPIREVVAFLSEFTTLEPGDVILTGSPAGTGRLEPGDVVEVEVAGVGVLRHSVVADAEDR